MLSSVRGEWSFADESTEEFLALDGRSAFLVHDGRLALSLWCITIILREAQDQLKRFLAEKATTKWWLSSFDREEALDRTRVLLCLSAECYTAWNCRRQCFQAQQVKEELQFVNLVLTKYPKSGETWAYRY